MFNQGLNALVEVGKVSDQTFQQYILKALGELAVYVDGMHGLIQCNEIIRWLYQLTDSKVREGKGGGRRIEKGGGIERGGRGEGRERWRYRRGRERKGREMKTGAQGRRIKGKRRERIESFYGSWEIMQDLQTVLEQS